MRKDSVIHSSDIFENGGYNIKSLILACDIPQEEKDYWVGALDHKNAISSNGFEVLPSELKCFIPYIYEAQSSLGNIKYYVPMNVVKAWQNGKPLPEIKHKEENEFVPELLNAYDYVNIKKEIEIDSRILSGLSRWYHFTNNSITVEQFVKICILEFINKDDVRRYLFSEKEFAETDYHKIKIGSREYL